MFKKMHHKLTFFCTLITGLILVTMTCICLYITQSYLWEREYTSFIENLNTMIAHFEFQSTISNQWILEMEANYHVDLHILDNGTPLFSEQLRSSKDMEKLFDQALEMAQKNNSFQYDNYNSSNILTKHIEFEMKGLDGNNYYAGLALIPKQNGNLTVVTLYSLTNLQNALLIQMALFGVVLLAAIALLSIFSWNFTKRLIQPIKESRERQVQFIAAASHELRSPLTVILTSLSAMKVADKKQSETFAETIQSEGIRMSHLINDMLTLANADNRTWSIQLNKIDLDTLLLQTYEKYEQLAASKNLVFEIQLPEDIPPACECDGERIAQVLSILIDNAMSYTPSGGRILLKLQMEGNKPLLSVSDNGPGIADEYKKTIFDRFYRADNSHKDKEHFGLGLCIAKEIVKLHKGKIWVADTPGGGATFYVML